MDGPVFTEALVPFLSPPASLSRRGRISLSLLLYFYPPCESKERYSLAFPFLLSDHYLIPSIIFSPLSSFDLLLFLFFFSSIVHRSRSAAMSFRMSSAPSGMGVAAHSKAVFLELKRKKVHRYVIFKIDEQKREVIVEKTGGPAENYEDFTASLPENDCRYAIYDFDFVTAENCQKSKIFFIAWSPSISRIRAKMLYATSKERFRGELDGVHYEIQATDPTEMDLEVLRDRAN